jgi:uncharacterized repeat protein (TIGR03843 family)
MSDSSETSAILQALKHGAIEVKGRFMWGSNYTFLVEVDHGVRQLKAVYKPSRGERPLWDFPSASLAHREAAAYIVSQALGWGMVPETVYRRDAPVGPGSLQRYIEHDAEMHYFNLDASIHERLRPVVLFDLLVNNADRKGGHIIMDDEKQIWLIDHGLCFHIEDKLRTVIWDFVDEPIPPSLKEDLHLLQTQLEPGCDLYNALAEHLSRGELRALYRRAGRLAEFDAFPNPSDDRRPYPWPPV